MLGLLCKAGTGGSARGLLKSCKYSDLPFWQLVKAAQQQPESGRHLKFLLFAAYGVRMATSNGERMAPPGYATLVAFSAPWGLPELSFSEAHCDAMIEQLGDVAEAQLLHPLHRCPCSPRSISYIYLFLLSLTYVSVSARVCTPKAQKENRRPLAQTLRSDSKLADQRKQPAPWRLHVLPCRYAPREISTL